MGVATSFAAAIADRYDLVRPIGHGGFGVVYEAWDKQRNATVALKKLNRITPAAAHRLKHEFRSLSGVAHRNLVRLFELEASGDEPFITMELVAGVDVLSWAWRFDRGAFGPDGTAATESGETAIGHKSVRVLPLGEPRPRVDYRRFRESMTQLCDGLSALHGAGKLHRDVKPSNVLVTAEGRVVLLDFGIVLDMHEEPVRLTDADVVVGTPEYMAPEQGSRQPLAPSADFYAMGVIMFEGLTGSLPFPSTGAQVLVDKLRDASPSVRSLAPDVPEDLAALVDALLEIEPDARPEADEIRARLGATSGPVSRNVTATRAESAPFVGRAEAIAVLEDARLRARRGRAQLVRVQGVSGMGKSALIRHFLDGVVERDEAVVLSGRCYEHESVPYKGFDGVMDSLVGWMLKVGDPLASAIVPRDAAMLARLFPLLERVPQIASAPRRNLQIPDPRQLRMRAFTALREMFGRLTDRRPMVIFIDDVQWGDADGAALLAELTAAPDPPAMLVILAARSERLRSSSQVRALLDPDRAFAPDNHLVLIDALPQRDARDLAAMLLGRVATPEIIERIGIESGGSPFFIGELCRYVVAHGGQIRTDEVMLSRVLGKRVSDLPPAERRLLETLSLADRPVTESAAFAAAKLDHSDGRSALASLRAAHLIRTTGGRSDRLEPYHDRVRETVVANLDQPRTRELHRALLDAVSHASTVDPELLFAHSVGAGEAERAIEFAEAAAAKAASALAFDRAAWYYAQARERVRNPARRAELGRKLADALAASGQGVEAADAYLAAIRGASEPESIEWRSRAAELLLFSGRVERGMAISREVAEDVGLRLPAGRIRALLTLFVLRLRLMLRGLHYRERQESELAPAAKQRLTVLWSVALGLSVVDNLVSMVLTARYLLAALDAGEPSRVARGLLAWAGFVGRQGGNAAVRGQAMIARAEPLVMRAPSPELRAYVAWFRGSIAYFSGRFASARADLGEAMRIFRDECTGVAWEVATCAHFQALAIFYTGDLDELLREHPRQLREADERGDGYLATALRSSFLVVVWLARDDAQGARTAIAQGAATWPRDGFQAQHWWELEALIFVDLYADDPERALTRVEERWPAVARSLMMHLQLVRIEAAWLRGTANAAAARGPATDRRLARALADARAIEREATPFGHALAALLRAAVATRRTNVAEAVSSLGDAVRQLEHVGLALFAKLAQRREKQLVGEAGARDLERIDAELRQSGVADPARLSRIVGL